MTITAESLRELARKEAEEFSEKRTYMMQRPQEKRLWSEAHAQSFKAGAELFLPALVEACGVLKAACRCDGKLDYTYSKYTPITCTFCESLARIAVMMEKR